MARREPRRARSSHVAVSRVCRPCRRRTDFVGSSAEELGLSVEKVHRQRGAVWRVRWRDELGRERSKVLGTKRDAEAFDAEIRRRRRTGELATMDAGKETLADFAEEWWRLYAVPNLAPKTLKVYADLWDTHVLPRLGGYRLRRSDARGLARFRADLARGGRRRSDHPEARCRSSRACFSARSSGIASRSNPARAVRKPPQRRMRAHRAASPGRGRADARPLLDRERTP